MLRCLGGFIEQTGFDKDFFFKKGRCFLTHKKFIFLPAFLITGLNFALAHPAEASSRLWLDLDNHPFPWAQGLGTTHGGMAGGQKWGTRQDRLTGQAWCTAALRGLATVDPHKVQKPIPWVLGVQPHPAAWEEQWDAGRTGGGGPGGGHLPTSPPARRCPWAPTQLQLGKGN